MKVGYYPGCSLHGTGKAYDISARTAMKVLGVMPEEVADWSCCGSTPAECENPLLSTALSARNLALAEAAGHEFLVAPCAACFSHLKKAGLEIAGNEKLAAKIRELIELDYQGQVKVLNLLQVFVDLVGIDALRKKVKKPLTGLRVVTYYGCLLVRPAHVAGFDDPVNPVSLDRIMEAAGATVLPWGAKTDCCGASFTMTNPEVVAEASGKIMLQALEAGADLVVTACPMCWMNLYRGHGYAREHFGPGKTMPTVYFTELLALALGVSPRALVMKKHLVNPYPVLRQKQIV